LLDDKKNVFFDIINHRIESLIRVVITPSAFQWEQFATEERTKEKPTQSERESVDVMQNKSQIYKFN